MPRRVGTGVDPRRLAMIVAVLGRHAGVALASSDVFVNVAGGVKIEEPGADLAVALAIASAARGTPVRDGVAAFGEVGLTGRLRPAAQAERRLDECAKMRIAIVLAPAGTGTRGDLRVAGAETLREAISAGLEAPPPAKRSRRRPSLPAGLRTAVAVPLRPCEKPAMMCRDAGRGDTAGTFT